MQFVRLTVPHTGSAGDLTSVELSQSLTPKYMRPAGRTNKKAEPLLTPLFELLDNFLLNGSRIDTHLNKFCSVILDVPEI